MKRNVFLRLGIVACVVAATVYLGACKKDIVTPINNSSPTTYDDPNYSAEARRIVGKIKNFKAQVVEKEYLTKGDAYLPIDSVIWNVEALFNASYTFPDRKYLETVKQDIHLYLTVNTKKEALMSTVADFYDEVTEAVRQAYAGDGINTDKSLMAVDVEEGETVGSNVEIIIHVISGRADMSTAGRDPVSGPFGPGDCWYFGEYGGTCDDPAAFGDAAEVIEDSINYYFRGTSVPNSGYRSINFNIVRVFLDGNEYVDANGNYYTYFYGLNDDTPYYLDYDMLNYYYNRELALILNIVPSDPTYQSLWPSSPAFLEVDIMGLIGIVGNQSCAYHRNGITYCNKEMIPVQMLDDPINLL